MRQLLAFAMLIATLPVPAHARTTIPAFASLIQETPTSTPEPTPTPDPALEQAKREAELAEELKKKAVADKERAEAEAARLKALVQPLGAPANVSVPSGNVSTDAAGWVESQMLAQEAARQITRKLTISLCTERITPGATPTPTPSVAAHSVASPKPAPLKVRTLVIHSASDLAGVELYGSIIGQLKKLKDELTKKNGEAVDALEKTDPTREPGAEVTDAGATLAFAAPGIATGVIKSVAELLNLFRTETSFTNQAITLNENTIVSHIVRNLNSGSIKGTNCAGIIRVYRPALYAPRLLESSENSDLITLLNDVETAKVEATGNVEKLDARIKQLKDLSAAFKSRTDKSKELVSKTKEKEEKEKALAKCKNNSCRKKIKAEIKVLDEEIAKLDKEIKKLDDDLKEVKANPNNFKDWIEKLIDLRAQTQGLVTATNLISAKLNTPDETTKLTAMAQLIRAEKLHKILSENGSYTLHVEVKANGTTKVKKNLFVDAKVRHSAGANLIYQLIEGGGVIAQGNELRCYIEYQSARDIQDMVSGTGSKRVTCKFPDDSDESEDEESEDDESSEKAVNHRNSNRSGNR